MHVTYRDDKVTDDIVSFSENHYDRITDTLESLITIFNETYQGKEYKTSERQGSLIGCLTRDFLFDTLNLQSKFFDKEMCPSCIKQTIKESINEIVEEFFWNSDYAPNLLSNSKNDE